MVLSSPVPTTGSDSSMYTSYSRDSNSETDLNIICPCLPCFQQLVLCLSMNKLLIIFLPLLTFVWLLMGRSPFFVHDLHPGGISGFGMKGWVNHRGGAAYLRVNLSCLFPLLLSFFIIKRNLIMTWVDFDWPCCCLFCLLLFPAW